MLQFFLKPVIILLAILLVVFISMGACNGNGEQTPLPLIQPSVTSQTPTGDEAVITIGNLTDFTGVSANAMEYINMALDDLVEYYNETNLIPGVRLKVESYDGQMNPARDIPGLARRPGHPAVG